MHSAECSLFDIGGERGAAVDVVREHQQRVVEGAVGVGRGGLGGHLAGREGAGAGALDGAGEVGSGGGEGAVGGVVEGAELEGRAAEREGAGEGVRGQAGGAEDLVFAEHVGAVGDRSADGLGDDADRGGLLDLGRLEADLRALVPLGRGAGGGRRRVVAGRRDGGGRADGGGGRVGAAVAAAAVAAGEEERDEEDELSSPGHDGLCNTGRALVGARRGVGRGATDGPLPLTSLHDVAAHGLLRHRTEREPGK